MTCSIQTIWRLKQKSMDTSVICQFSCRLPNDFPDLLDLSPVSRDFGLEFRLQWPGWMFCWMLRICPKVGYEWFPYHPGPSECCLEQPKMPFPRNWQLAETFIPKHWCYSFIQLFSRYINDNMYLRSSSLTTCSRSSVDFTPSITLIVHRWLTQGKLWCLSGA